ncbi:hypothetical protein [Serratia liquefaciens]|uniref:hypothetical protein n=1 Tax=Serratia liquefaciens TaxID=614 RepID=UPI0021586241|nr:hypothetical protein [Serratia liquefaciens]
MNISKKGDNLITMKRMINFEFLQLNERKLSEQWMFWLSILTPLSLSILLSIPLWLQTKINISAEGYDNFLQTFKLPIGVLSLSIPLVAIVAHIHRTIQTAEQIQTTRKKNAADSFFSHHKFMIEAFGKIASKDINISMQPIEYKIGDPYQLYDNLFKNSSYEHGINPSNLFSITSEIENEINKIDASIIKSRDILDNKFEKIGLLREISDSIINIENKLTLTVPKFKSNGLVMDKQNGVTIMLVTDYLYEDELKDRLQSLIYFTKKIFQIINHHYIDPDTTAFYANLKTANHLFFSELFSDITLTKMSIHYCITSVSSNRLDKPFNEYENALRRRKKTNKV